MPLFAVVWHYTSDTELRDRVRPEHRSYVFDLATRGLVLTAGPFGDGSGGLLIYHVADEVELAKVISDDPYSRNGAIERYDAWQWEPVIGTLANSRQ